MLVSAPLAFAHIERASYWPDPGVDNAAKGGAGGKVPKTRSLFSALDKKPRGETRVVCQGRSSLKALKKDLEAAQKGYHLRLSDKRKEIGEKKAEDLLEFNQRLLRKCKFDSIQDAVDASGNNDRDRGHARHLHRAGFAGGAYQRPELRRPARGERRGADRRRSPTPTT